MEQKIQNQLVQIAFKRSKPFCYSCYQTVETLSGHCNGCGSDDHMRILPGFGVEYGTDWIIEEVLKEEVSPANVEEDFENMIRDCYPETTTVAWCKFDTVTLLKEQDPIAWDCAVSDYQSNEESEGNLLLIGSTYYRTQDIETFIDREGS